MTAWRRSAGLGLAFLGRDWRSGELRLLVLSLVLAVAAMTSVGFFADRLRLGLERDAAQLLGADLVVSADQTIADDLLKEALARHLSLAQTVTFPSMALAHEQARLASVKAVSAGYPLRGALRVASEPAAADAATTERPGAGEIWVDAALLSDLNLKMGDSLHLGDSSFRITRIITVEPDRGLSFVNIAPRVLMRLEDLDATHLIQAGSRETRRLLVAGPLEAVNSFRTWITPRLVRGQHLESLESGRPEVRATLDRAQQFLSLVALLTAMLAAVAVALAARRFTQRHLDSCAVMRCLGSSQSDVLILYLFEFLAVGALGALAGVLLGFFAHYMFILVLGSLIQTNLPPARITSAVQGFLVGFVLLIGFALPPVLQLRHVAPLRVLRRDLGGPRPTMAFGFLAGAVLFVALLLWTAHNVKVGLLTSGGFAGAFLVFSLIAWGAVLLGGPLRHAVRLSAGMRFALASIQRRPVATIVQTVSLALGLTALLLLSLTRSDLVTAWRNAAPPNAPNRFVINLQPDERDRFTNFMKSEGLNEFDLAPMIRGRLIAINGRQTSSGSYADEQAKRLVDREFNLSYSSTLPVHNRVSAGQWFGGRSDELSIEAGIAETLKLKLGDRLRFDVAGQQVEGRITSFRKLEWDSMHVNFFVIFPPAALKDFPQTWISAFHLSASQTDVGNRLVGQFPNVTVIDMGAVLQQIQSILDQVVTAVEFLFVFTLAAGILVLYAALLSSRDERTREAALLRALGASRAQLSGAQFAEFAALGLLAGLLAAAGAVGIGWALATYVFHFPYIFDFTPWWTGGLGGIVVAALGGWLGLRPVLLQPPLATLRDA
ncbi:MAG: FtsX-like permease family protein [Burkholderiaceae bacterium]